jgi:hypothetical protein
MEAAGLIQIGLQVLPLVTTGVTEFIAWLEALRTNLRQSGEWTAEQDADFTAKLAAKENDPRYQQDPPPPAA